MLRITAIRRASFEEYPERAGRNEKGAAKRILKKIGSDPSSVWSFARGLQERFGCGKVAVVTEQSSGSLVYALQDFAFIELYAINPQAAAKLRKSLYPSGVKSDDIDAEGLMRMLFTHRDRMIRVRRKDPATARLDACNRHRRELVDQRVQQCNRLGSILKQYYPQALPMLGEDLFAPINLAFLSQWPCYQKLARTREGSLRGLLPCPGKPQYRGHPKAPGGLRRESSFV